MHGNCTQQNRSSKTISSKVDPEAHVQFLACLPPAKRIYIQCTELMWAIPYPDHEVCSSYSSQPSQITFRFEDQ